MIEISIDLETFATCHDASVAAIGVCSTIDEDDAFFCYVDDPDGVISPGTVRWHAIQKDMPSNVGMPQSAILLTEALASLRTWLRDRQAHRQGKARVWAHGGFDLTILAEAYRRAGWHHGPPWAYRNARDLRTLYDLAGGRPKVVNRGKHNALSDARAQLEEVRVCLEILGHK